MIKFNAEQYDRPSVNEAKSKGLRKVEGEKSKVFVKSAKSDNRASGENTAIFWLRSRIAAALFHRRYFWILRNLTGNYIIRTP